MKNLSILLTVVLLILFCVTGKSTADDTLQARKIGEYGNFWGSPGIPDATQGYLYFLSSVRLQCFDASDPRNIVNIGYYEFPQRYASMQSSLLISGGLGLVCWLDRSVDSSELALIDLSDPTAPEWLSSIKLDNYVGLKSLYGNYLYLIGSGRGGLDIIDIADRENPVRLETLFPEVRINNFRINGDFGYMYRSLDSLVVVLNMENPENPDSLASFFSPRWDEVTFVEGGVIAISSNNVLYLFDASDPRNIHEIYRNVDYQFYYLSSFEDHLLVTASRIQDGYTLVDYDLSTPDQPRIASLTGLPASELWMTITTVLIFSLRKTID
jgi:hypothetical protein